jgi:hypothetical protein
LVAVRRDQLASACAGLTGLAGKPAVLFLGNNPAGRAGIAGGMPGDIYLGFPGVGGVMTGGTADYVRIRQQPTALQAASDPRLAAFESALADYAFAIQRIADMDGWLAYHAAFVACNTAALYRCGTDPVRLAADRATLGDSSYEPSPGALSDAVTAMAAPLGLGQRRPFPGGLAFCWAGSFMIRPGVESHPRISSTLLRWGGTSCRTRRLPP